MCDSSSCFPTLKTPGKQPFLEHCLIRAVPANALVIGISKFSTDRWHDLQGEQDAERMDRCFKEHGFSTSLRKGADREAWAAAVDEFEKSCVKSVEETSSAATVVNAVYIASHGYQLQNASYPSCVPSDSQGLQDDFHLDELLDRVKGMKTAMGRARILFLIIVDVCRSEASGRVSWHRHQPRRIKHSLALVMAWQEGQRAIESGESGGQLTSVLLQHWTQGQPLLCSLLRTQLTGQKTFGFQCPQLEILNMPCDVVLVPGSCPPCLPFPKKDGTGLLTQDVLSAFLDALRRIWSGQSMKSVENAQNEMLGNMMKKVGYFDFLEYGQDLRLLFRMQLCETCPDMPSTISFLEDCLEQLQKDFYKYREPLLIMALSWISGAHSIAARACHRKQDRFSCLYHVKRCQERFAQALIILDACMTEDKFVLDMLRNQRKMLNSALECDAVNLMPLPRAEVGNASTRNDMIITMRNLDSQITSMSMAAEPEAAIHQLSSSSRLILEQAGASPSAADIAGCELCLGSIRNKLHDASLRVQVRYFMEVIRLSAVKIAVSATADGTYGTQNMQNRLATLHMCFQILHVDVSLKRLRAAAKRLQWSWQLEEAEALLEEHGLQSSGLNGQTWWGVSRQANYGKISMPLLSVCLWKLCQGTPIATRQSVEGPCVQKTASICSKISGSKAYMN